MKNKYYCRVGVKNGNIAIGTRDISLNNQIEERKTNDEKLIKEVFEESIYRFRYQFCRYL